MDGGVSRTRLERTGLGAEPTNGVGITSSETCGTGAPERAACAPPISADGCARPIATAPRHRGVAWIFLNNAQYEY